MASADAAGLDDLIEVVIAYGAAARVVDLVTLRVAPGTTVRQAVQASGMLSRHPGLVLDAVGVGVWGRTVRWDDGVVVGDRIELYRPLRVDPKEARRQRYRAQGEKGRRKPGQRA